MLRNKLKEGIKTVVEIAEHTIHFKEAFHMTQTLAAGGLAMFAFPIPMSVPDEKNPLAVKLANEINKNKISLDKAKLEELKHVLWYSAREGDVDKVKKIIDETKYIPSWELTCRSYKTLNIIQNDLKYKIENNAEFIREFESFPTPLLIAIYKRKSEVVKELLKFPNEDVNITSTAHTHSSPLMLACWYEEPEVVNYLLQCPNLKINYTDSFGCHALMYAAKRGDLTVLSGLLNYPGIDPNTIDKRGLNVLYLAVELGLIDIVKLFLSKTDINTLFLLNQDKQAIQFGLLLLAKSITSRKFALTEMLIDRIQLHNVYSYFHYIFCMFLLAKDGSCTNQNLKIHAVTQLKELEKIALPLLFDIKKSVDNTKHNARTACVFFSWDSTDSVIIKLRTALIHLPKSLDGNNNLRVTECFLDVASIFMQNINDYSSEFLKKLSNSFIDGLKIKVSDKQVTDAAIEVKDSDQTRVINRLS